MGIYGENGQVFLPAVFRPVGVSELCANYHSAEAWLR